MVRIRAAVAALATLVALAGCADASTGDAGGPASATLAQSKSYAQLLRNEASSRLPAIILKDVADTTDGSTACETVEADPLGLSRSWASSTTILLTNSTAPRVGTVAEDLAASFVDQGWTAQVDGAVTTLTSEASLASIEIATTPRATGQEPEIRITATGVCADTDGPESAEVTALENPEATPEG